MATSVNEILETIETKSNEIVAKLEVLRTLEEQGDSVKKEIENIKKKLENDEISKFSYATMLEVNKNNMTTNTNYKKKTWDELATGVNAIGELLDNLKEIYNQKLDNGEIVEATTKKK
ncbi:MAG: hypothetical protein V1824_01020 [archaeon]